MRDMTEAAAVAEPRETMRGDKPRIQNTDKLLQVLAELEAEFEQLFNDWHAKTGPASESKN